ncbi:MAG: GNAT family N-acetyltransferase [Nitriliruptoraceae bacterium]
MSVTGGRDDGGAASTPSVQRVDDRLGLAVRRVTLGPRTLVTYARDHVTVRTPSRPDLRDGNTIDLVAPPAADDLERWVSRFRETVGALGAPHVQLRWETSLAPDAPAQPPAEDPHLAPAVGALGMQLSATSVLLLDALDPPDHRPPAELVPVAPPATEPAGAIDRRWYAATVLYRYLDGETPDDWRDRDTSFVEWSVEQQRELAVAGRCQVWLAMRHGAPVARLTVMHDRQGLAAVEDVVTHPVHRRHGIAAALIATAASTHLEVHPGSRIGVATQPGSAAERLCRRLGFRPHATVWTAYSAG